MGRITYCGKPGAQSMLLYCRKHQCYRGKAVSRGPTEKGAILWLMWGWGAECGSKAEHERKFDELIYTK